jgi:hypothetical protein
MPGFNQKRTDSPEEFGKWLKNKLKKPDNADRNADDRHALRVTAEWRAVRASAAG